MSISAPLALNPEPASSVTWSAYLHTQYNRYVEWTKTYSLNTGTIFTLDDTPRAEMTCTKVMAIALKVFGMAVSSIVLLPLSALFNVCSWAKESLCKSVKVPPGYSNVNFVPNASNDLPSTANVLPKPADAAAKANNAADNANNPPNQNE